MTYDEILKLIGNSPFQDGCWAYSDRRGIFTLKSDLDVRIVRTDDDDRSFDEEWTRHHADPRAYRYEYEIYFRASFVTSFLLIAVDGVRAYLPLPEAGTTRITRRAYVLARAVDHQGTLDEYIERSKLTLDEST